MGLKNADPACEGHNKISSQLSLSSAHTLVVDIVITTLPTPDGDLFDILKHIQYSVFIQVQVQ